MNWLLHQFPSLGLTLWGVGVFWLAGNKRRSAWALGVAGQGFWLAYAVWLAQWGLLIGCFFYGAMYVRNWLKWSESEVTRRLRMCRVFHQWGRWTTTVPGVVQDRTCVRCGKERWRSI